MGEILQLVTTSFNRSLSVEHRSYRLTGDPGAVVLREILERSGIVEWMVGLRAGDPTMIRSELIARLAQQYPELTHRDVTKVVDTIFGEITEALSRGDRVELRGFGSFSTVMLDARTGRNPRTGEAVVLGEKRAIRFRAGRRLRDRLNPGGGPDDGQA